VRPIEPLSSLTNSANTRQYGFFSLYELIRRIVDEADRQALIEFHNRPLFTFKGEDTLTCTEFIVRCRNELLYSGRAIGNSYEIADRAHDLTIDKFSNLSTTLGDAGRSGTGKNQLKRNRSDCRSYFRAVQHRLDKSYKKSPNKGQLELEAETAAAIQGLVRRHFHLSVKEAKRKVNPLWSRYFWNVGGWKICVWLPVHLKGRERREWLEKKMSTPDPTKPGERERIQALINQKIGNIGVIPFNENVHQNILEGHEYRSDQKGDVCQSLRDVVAQEKAGNIACQRRAIRALGRDKLKQMVLHIFEKVAGDDYHDITVAKTFGLSKATFSRFAGSRWNASNTNIPDLWLNTAQVLAGHPDFKEAAMEAGVWKQVEITLNRVGKKKACNE
jgi:hypothetical protein